MRVFDQGSHTFIGDVDGPAENVAVHATDQFAFFRTSHSLWVVSEHCCKVVEFLANSCMEAMAFIAPCLYITGGLRHVSGDLPLRVISPTTYVYNVLTGSLTTTAPMLNGRYDDTLQ